MNDSNDLKSKLSQVTQYIRSQNKVEARKILKELMKTYPNEADIYYYASFVVDDPAQQISALKRALSLNPKHERSKTRLEEIQSGKRKEKEPYSEPTKSKDNRKFVEIPNSPSGTNPQINSTPSPVINPFAVVTNVSDNVQSAFSKFLGDEQSSQTVEKIYNIARQILTSSEEILYIAIQTSFTVSPDCVVATNRRFIIYKPKFLGGYDMQDHIWRDLKDIQLKESFARASLNFELVNADVIEFMNLPKVQARKLYRIAQEMEEKVLEERRIRDMEEKRAASGGIIFQTGMGIPGMVQQPGVAAYPPQPTSVQDDPVQKLTKLKGMLDAGLITQNEYDAKKSDILSRL